MTYHELYALNRGSADYHGAPEFPAKDRYTVQVHPETKVRYYVAKAKDPVTGQMIFCRIKFL